MNWTGLAVEPQKRRLFTRRGFLKLSAAGIVAAAGIGAYAVEIEPHWVEITHVNMSLNNLPAHWVGKRIVQISDIHIGRRVSNEFLLESFKTIEQLDPDLLLITGDFQTARSDERVDDVWRLMRNLRPPAGGCLAVLGNHDYGAGWKDVRVGDMLADRLTDCGIDVLRNNHRTIDGLTILGVEDLWAPSYDARATMEQRPHDAPTIAMCHNPDGVDGAEWTDFKGWVLSGHTHGGQCRPPFLPAPIVPCVNKRYQAGVYDVGADRTLYINRGLGHALQLRFNVRPEITCFTLTNRT